jgi:hypothetical protein
MLEWESLSWRHLDGSLSRLSDACKGLVPDQMAAECSRPQTPSPATRGMTPGFYDAWHRVYPMNASQP